jgi:nucleotide-binding universal stress UspA family protein
MNSPNWQRILTTTDFSSFGNQAVNYAHALAERFGAELHVLHVAKDSCDIAVKHGVTGAFGGEDAKGHNWLGQILGETGSIRRVDAVHVGSDPAEKITQYAQANNIDLIVMATHGRSGLAHLWLGSITEKVIRSAHCPVLALRPSKEELNGMAKEPSAAKSVFIF